MNTMQLTEGSVSVECILACNWNFDLSDGRKLYGGDRLRIHPVGQRGDDIWIDLADPPFAGRYASITSRLRDAFDDYGYDRLAREIARLTRRSIHKSILATAACSDSPGPNWRRFGFTSVSGCATV